MRALILDTETTDLIHSPLLPEKQQPRVIEFFGQVVSDEGNVIKEVEFRCNPGMRLAPKTTKITGLTDTDLANEPPFGMNSSLIEDLAKEANCVVAHNLSYDYAVINIEFKRLGKQLDWPPIKVCTVEETEWIHGYRLNLAALHTELFGEGFTKAHSARGDVTALTRCWLEMRKKGYV